MQSKQILCLRRSPSTARNTFQLPFSEAQRRFLVPLPGRFSSFLPETTQAQMLYYWFRFRSNPWTV